MTLCVFSSACRATPLKPATPPPTRTRSASSQVFFLLKESELTPSGANLLDGRYAVFGYAVAGQDSLGLMKVCVCVCLCVLRTHCVHCEVCALRWSMPILDTVVAQPRQEISVRKVQTPCQHASPPTTTQTNAQIPGRRQDSLHQGGGRRPKPGQRLNEVHHTHYAGGARRDAAGSAGCQQSGSVSFVRTDILNTTNEWQRKRFPPDSRCTYSAASVRVRLGAMCRMRFITAAVSAASRMQRRHT